MPLTLQTIEIGRVLLSGWNNMMGEGAHYAPARPATTNHALWMDKPQFVPSVDVASRAY